MTKEEFWLLVERTPTCWLWHGRTTPKGYGTLWFNGKNERAHRLALSWAIGELPPNTNALHRCDNPRCVNPDHLFPGTHADNIRDMDAKKRRRILCGAENGRARLTVEQVAEIKRAIASGESYDVVGLKYGVGIGAVRDIAVGRRWADVVGGVPCAAGLKLSHCRDRDAWIWAARQSGATIRSLAEAINVTYARAHQIVKKAERSHGV